MNAENKERVYKGLMVNGFLMLLIVLAALALMIWSIAYGADEGSAALALGVGIPSFIIFILGLKGYFVQEPNMARVMIFFGKYVGTCRQVGFFWVNPLCSRAKISLRIRNMDIDPIKVNDKVGNPVLIGMVLVWKIRDTYRVMFDLDSQSGVVSEGLNNSRLEHFVRIQGDAALREVTGQFAYDQSEATQEDLTLRDGGDVINELLERKINERLAMAGIEVVEARINYLAYAPEIAAVMLRRQQASAIITAREKIVEGAVSMVEMAMDRIEKRGIVTLDNERKAQMVSNLLVVLCADESTTPVVNASAD